MALFAFACGGVLGFLAAYRIGQEALRIAAEHNRKLARRIIDLEHERRHWAIGVN